MARDLESKHPDIRWKTMSIYDYDNIISSGNILNYEFKMDDPNGFIKREYNTGPELSKEVLNQIQRGRNYWSRVNIDNIKYTIGVSNRNIVEITCRYITIYTAFYPF